MGSSKMDSAAVYTLFEELKQKIDELGKKPIPDNQIDSTSDSQELIMLIEALQIQIKQQQQFSPEQIKALQTNLTQYSAYSLGKVNDSLRKVITELKTVITPIDEKFNLLKSPQNMVIRNDHNFRVDFQNSKAAITMISMALLILLSLGGNIWQLNRNSQLKDNDLKYRYIKSTNGINPANLNMLEDVFYYQRDKSKVREIRQKVEGYERRLIETAKEIERNRIQNEQNKR
jgi:hypothetical protein